MHQNYSQLTRRILPQSLLSSTSSTSASQSLDSARLKLISSSSSSHTPFPCYTYSTTLFYDYMYMHIVVGKKGRKAKIGQKRRKTAKHDVKLTKPAQNQRKNRRNGKYNFSGLIVHILFHLT